MMRTWSKIEVKQCQTAKHAINQCKLSFDNNKLFVDFSPVFVSVAEELLSN